MSALPEITGRASCADWAQFSASAQAAALDGWGWTLLALGIVSVLAVGAVLALLWARQSAAERAAVERHQALLSAVREASTWAQYYRDLASALLAPSPAPRTPTPPAPD